MIVIPRPGVGLLGMARRHTHAPAPAPRPPVAVAPEPPPPPPAPVPPPPPEATPAPAPASGVRVAMRRPESFLRELGASRVSAVTGRRPNVDRWTAQATVRGRVVRVTADTRSAALWHLVALVQAAAIERLAHGRAA